MSGELLINPKTIVGELQKLKPQMEAALPRHMSPDRMARIALTEIRKTPKLLKCTPESFFGSLIAASQLGLEPGVNGQCYLIPYKTTCTLVPGWRGYMDLLSRTRRASAWTGAVYDGDEFDYEYGDKPFVHHKPGKWNGHKSAMQFVYAVGRQNGMEWPVIDVWDVDRVWAHRDRNNKCFDKSDHYSFAHPEMYARKIPLLQVIKYLPSSIELQDASALDIAQSEGKQNLTIDMALTGNLLDTTELSEEEVEAESLMESLGWPENKRKMCRDQYHGRLSEQVSYLRAEVEKLQRLQPKKDESPAGSKKNSKNTTSKDSHPEQSAQSEVSAQPETHAQQDQETQPEQVTMAGW